MINPVAIRIKHRKQNTIAYSVFYDWSTREELQGSKKGQGASSGCGSVVVQLPSVCEVLDFISESGGGGRRQGRGVRKKRKRKGVCIKLLCSWRSNQVKSKPMEWKRSLPRCTSDWGFISRMYKNSEKKQSKKQMTYLRKWAQDLHQGFQEEEGEE